MTKVYMTDSITAESLVRIYEAMGVTLPGRVAVKISTGEPGGHNFLQPNLIKDLVNRLNCLLYTSVLSPGKPQR